ncbi:MAG: hypothetical protein WKI04_14750 [Ferruginibacter sp.]
MGYMVSGTNLSSNGTLNPASDATTAFTGILASSSGGPITIAGNILRGWNLSNTLANVNGITASSTNPFTNPSIAINNNFIGTTASGWINFAHPNVDTLNAISVGNTSILTATYSISNNDITGISASGATENTGLYNFINVVMASPSNNAVNISNNTFTNLDINTTGKTIFISHSYPVSASGVQTIDSNRIIGSFNRSSGSGDLFLLSSNANASSTAQIKHRNNNFSNITVSGTTVIHGFQNAGGSSNPTKIITGNIFTNWIAGSGAVTALDHDHFGGTASSVSNNTIMNIAGLGAITGIKIGAIGNASGLSISNNNLSGLSSSGTGGVVTGISYGSSSNEVDLNSNTIHTLSSTATNVDINAINIENSAADLDIFQNKIYDISAAGPDVSVSGIRVAGGTTINLYNNLIGDLRTPASGLSGPSIAGLNIAGGNTVNAFYNTIHLNGTSSASLFSSSAVYSNTITSLTLRNNIFNNISKAGVLGKTVSYWRMGTDLSTYSSSSNNNVFYAGIPASRQLIFFDGSSIDQTFVSYQLRVNARDNNSISEQPAFLSIMGSDPGFLHLDPAANCSISGNGNNANILIDQDYDGDARTVVTPFLTSIGADEVGKKNVWTGLVNSNWNNGGNWSGGYVPDAADITADIPSAPLNQPVIAVTESYQVLNLTIAPGGLLTNFGTIKIAGTITTSPAAINNFLAGVVTGSITLNGTCIASQSLSGAVFSANSVNNFTVGNDANIATGVGNALNISGILSFGNVTGKILNTGDNVTLRSTVSNRQA